MTSQGEQEESGRHVFKKQPSTGNCLQRTGGKNLKSNSHRKCLWNTCCNAQGGGGVALSTWKKKQNMN